MTHPTKIGWATHSANVYEYEAGGWHCVKVSEGCRNCYAEKMNGRFGSRQGNGKAYKEQSRKHLGKVSLNRTILDSWKTAKRPRRIFLNSMTDTFLETIPQEMIFETFDAMAAAPMQLFYVLTKRAMRMAEVVNDWLQVAGLRSVPNNIMLGVSVESEKVLRDRVFWLSHVPALRFLSLEPLLGKVSLREWLPLLDWLIAGGESQVGARPMHYDWAEPIQQEAQEAGVPFFFKQWGMWWPLEELVTYHGAKDDALAHQAFGFLDPDGTFYDRWSLAGQNTPQGIATRLSSSGYYNGRLLVVRPKKQEKPENATLRGIVYEEYSEKHQPLM